ncbi:hypothetical protein NS226_01505 [Aureimonas ureilytica]|uniref:ORC1/DEAH AAA+ ATPase domain-containing protein n=1 Tax=Aureimonas ureilytica TaxID=401562 RepID=A0A175RFN8_9HYPH|nr:hypothetical protein NS226_01505 [Aureimonas ureilytica]
MVTPVIGDLQGTVMTAMRSIHIPTANDLALKAAVDSMLDSIVVEVGQQHEGAAANAAFRGGYAVLIVAPAGAGKTQALRRMLAERPEFKPREDGSRPIHSTVAPSPFTLSTLGNKLARELGYQTNRVIREAQVWPLVHSLLADRGVRIVHIDEAQHADQMRDMTSIQKVESTLKGLMQAAGWPIWLILSGLPELKRFCQEDPSMNRRVRVVEFPTLAFPDDVTAVRKTVEQFGLLASFIDCKTVMTDDVVHRLMHGALYQYGIITEMVQDAIGECARTGDKVLTEIHFAEAYGARTNAPDEQNPFLSPYFKRIDVSKALYVEEVDEDGKPTGRRSLRGRK